MKTNFKPKMKMLEGHWWALVDLSGKVETWASIGKVGAPLTEVTRWYQLARFYYSAGILSSITGPIVRHDSERVLMLVPGCCKSVDRAAVEASGVRIVSEEELNAA